MAEQDERLEGLVQEETCAKESIDELEVCRSIFHMHTIEQTNALSAASYWRCVRPQCYRECEGFDDSIHTLNIAGLAYIESSMITFHCYHGNSRHPLTTASCPLDTCS